MVNFLLVPPRTIYPISTVHNEYIATLELEVHGLLFKAVHVLPQVKKTRLYASFMELFTHLAFFKRIHNHQQLAIPALSL